MKSIYFLLVCGLLISACTSSPSSEADSDDAPLTATPTFQVIPSNTIQPTDTEFPTPTVTLTPKPSATRIIEVTSSPTSEVALCTNKAEFVRHLSVSDNTVLLPGVYFAKVWRIKNVGTCIWTPDYTFVFDSGDDFSSVSVTPLTREVQPGDTIDIQVTLVTPMEPEKYTANWLFKDSNGDLFGAGETGMQPFSAVVVVKPLVINERLETLSCG